jgi:hypothetical protein
MAKPNYSFEKRQRELAKKKKKEEKLAEKNARKAAGGLQPDEGQASVAEDDGGDSDTDAGAPPAEDRTQP